MSTGGHSKFSVSAAHDGSSIRNQSSREFCYQPEIWSFLVRNVWLGRFIYINIYRGWCLDIANSGSCRGKMRVIVEKASNQVSKETRRRMARECRGAGSSLVISMETPYDRTIY